MIKTRPAPSPTGMFHIGSLRTALYDYLYAKKHGGIFLLRIEDTDRARLVKGSLENVINSLFWGGLAPDEGVTFDEKKHIVQIGKKGPYIQSERLDIYKKYAEQLLDQGHAFYCFCTKERLDELRKMQQLNKQPTGYDGACKSLSKEDTEKKINAGESHVVRLNMPDEGRTTWTDMVRGDVTFENALIDDQVLVKADGFPTYHLAVVVDDHLMEVTHVFRGEEWLSSTPKHIVLYNMFGWNMPQYAHLPLLVNEKKQKLSKRHGDVSVIDFKEKGYLPEAIINFVAFLGWNPGTEQEIFTLEELIEAFDFSHVHKAAAVFNYEKLDWYNKQWIMKLSDEELSERARSLYEKEGIEIGDWRLDTIVALEKGRANTLVDIVENTRFIFADTLDYDPKLLVWKKADEVDAREKLGGIHAFLSEIKESEWGSEGMQKKVMKWIEDNDYENGNVLWPTRVALSGQKNSPGPFEIMAVLGKEKSLERIQEAIQK